MIESRLPFWLIFVHDISSFNCGKNHFSSGAIIEVYKIEGRPIPASGELNPQSMQGIVKCSLDPQNRVWRDAGIPSGCDKFAESSSSEFFLHDYSA